MTTALIENVGPIHHLEIEFPEGGGVTVLRGTQGVGKSTALAAAQAHIAGKGSLTKRDGSEEPGRVVAFGASITVGQRTTRSGRAEVIALEGDVDISTLVDPGIDDPIAADRQRIKAAVRLSKIPASLDLFAGVINGYEAKLSPKARGEADLIEMAAAVKRDLQSAAQFSEKETERLIASIKAAQVSIEGVDLSAECDEVKLRQAHTDAVAAKATIEAQAKAAKDAAETHAKAVAQAKAAREAYTGPTVDEASKSVDELTIADKRLRDEADRIGAAIAELQVKLDAKNEEIEVSERNITTANERLRFAQQYEASLITPDSPPAGPAVEQIAAAASAVEQASKAIERGAVVRAARKHQQNIAVWKQERFGHEQDAERLRKAAKDIDAVLSKCVASETLTVVDGRLMAPCEGRGVVPFAELSQGQRWIAAIDLAIKAVGECGLIPIPQEAWDGIAPENRERISEHARSRRVNILTAESTDGELRAETL